MCGICGEIRFDGEAVSLATIRAMRDTLNHRGPDDKGEWISHSSETSCGLGHTRLSIIDLSPGGHQPMIDPTGQYLITFNGEIYNYQELRVDLQQKGVCFKTQSDTEVLLHAYINYKEECVSYLTGMFAFAIWDIKKQELFCARDRIGEKFLYFAHDKNVFQFASEIKALLVHPISTFKPDKIALYDYLSAGLMHHGDRTFFEGIHLLPAGHWIKINKSGITTRQYWNLQTTKLSDPDEIFSTIRGLLVSSIGKQLRSDVPVGILLSGGLDSSTITAIAAQQSNNRVQAFTISYDDPAIDESKYAIAVAKQCNADLHMLRPEGNGLWEELESLIRAQDGPTHAPEVYSNWCMMRAVAKDGIKVLLCGQGGDEIFGGYGWYVKYFLLSLVKKFKIKELHREFNLLPVNFPNDNTRSRLYMILLLLQSFLPYYVKKKIKPELKGINVLCTAGFKKLGHRDLNNLKTTDPLSLQSKMYNDLVTNTVPHYLRYEDANSMHFGIEERVPMLDYQLIEFLHSLSADMKIHNGNSKYALRESVKNLVPHSIIDRKDKRGLSVPHDTWFRTELRNPISELLTGDSRLADAGIVDKDSLREELLKYMESKPTYLNRLVWRFINIEKWLQLYF